MMFIILYLMTIMIMSLLFIFLNMFFSMIKSVNYEKNLPFECGFTPITKSYLPFSLPFYLMSLMFLIFDVEIILLLPMIFFLFNLNSLLAFLTFIIFIMTLIFTLLLEWMNGYLNWLF